MVNDPSELLLDTFATSPDERERVRALSELMSKKIIPKRANDARFEAGLQRWLLCAHSSQVVPEIRLLAVAELIRSTQQLKKRQVPLIKSLVPSLEVPFPPLSLLEDSEERLNVARACSMLDAPWMQVYRAQSLANEESSPKTRAEMFDGIVSRVDSISEVLDLLISSFESIRPGTENPADSLAKRLTRTLEVFRVAVLNSFLEAGPEVGQKFDTFVRRTLSSTGKPQDDEVKFDLTREIALTLHDLVRSRFSLSTEPQTFSALKYCRSLFPTSSWPSEVRKETDLLVQDVSEALVLLGRMGVPNQDLLERLDLVCGIKDRARAVAVKLAENHVELDETIRSWLRNGRVVTTFASSEVLQDSLLGAVEESLGLALIEARKFTKQRDIERQLSTSLEIFDPSLVHALGGYVAQASAVITALEDVAKRRELDLLGVIGEEIDFAPKYFDLIGPLRGTHATVLRPAVVKTDRSGAIGSVVKKGLVE